jgi:hypothetical protein
MTTFDYIRHYLTLSDEDFFRTWHEEKDPSTSHEWFQVISWYRIVANLSDEEYQTFCYENGENDDLDRWRQELKYLREIERLRRPLTMPISRLPQQPSLFDRAQVDGEGVYIHSDGTAAKIGRTAVSERERRRSHQTGNPRNLVLLAWLPGASEHAMLERFDHLHIRGEWYRLEPELLEFIHAWQLVEGVFD